MTLLTALVGLACGDGPTRPGEGLVPVAITFATTAPDSTPDRNRPRIRHLALTLDSVRLADDTPEACEPDDGACTLLLDDTVRIRFPKPGEDLVPLAAAAHEGRYSTFVARVREVRIQGFSDGQSFDRSVPLRTTVALELPEPLELSAPSAEMVQLTVLAQPEHLLIDADGGTVDPLTTSLEALADLLAYSLERALIVFREGGQAPVDSTTTDAASAHTPPSNFGLCSGYYGQARSEVRVGGRTKMPMKLSLMRELVENIRETGMTAARKRREVTALQNRRKLTQTEIRDRLIAEAEARDERLSMTAATDSARAHPEYIACLDEIALKQFEADAAEVAYTAARALFRAAITAPDEAGRLAAAA